MLWLWEPIRGAETEQLTNERSSVLGYRWLVNSGSGFTVDILTGSKIFLGGLLHEVLHHIKQSLQMIIGIKLPKETEKQLLIRHIQL